MKLVIFGTGAYYNNYKGNFGNEDEIIAFIDNNTELVGSCLDGIPVYSPNEIGNISYDAIVLMASWAADMKKQLLGLGVSENKIYYCGQYYRKIRYGRFTYYGNLGQCLRGKKSNKKVLVINSFLDYVGGSLAAAYAAKAFLLKGYSVILAVSGGKTDFLNEWAKENVPVVIYPALPYIEEEDLDWVKPFDVVFVNGFNMIQCVCEISKVRPVIWWIHEPGDKHEKYYGKTRYQFEKYAQYPDFRNISIYGVSAIAKRGFNRFYPANDISILPYGIPDKYENKAVGGHEGLETGKIIFAIIGTVSAIKAQRDFIEAIGMLKKSEKDNAEFWIIGNIANNAYGKQIISAAVNEPSIKIWGQMNRTELNSAYKEIDVVVCPSIEESMSIVLTEGMMHEKLCISSDATGMAAYIEDGENGFICEAGNVEKMAERMRWFIQNRGAEKIYKIRRKARQTYERYFTMEVFADSLESILMQAIADYGLSE